MQRRMRMLKLHMEFLSDRLVDLNKMILDVRLMPLLRRWDRTVKVCPFCAEGRIL